MDYALLLIVFLSSSAELIYTSFLMVPNGDFMPISTTLVHVAHHLAVIAAVLCLVNLFVVVFHTLLPEVVAEEKQKMVRNVVISIVGILVLVLIVYSLTMAILVLVNPGQASYNATTVVAAFMMVIFSLGLVLLGAFSLKKERSFLTIMLLVVGFLTFVPSLLYAIIESLNSFQVGGFAMYGWSIIPYYIALGFTIVAILGLVGINVISANERGGEKSDLYVPLKDTKFDNDGYLNVPEDEKKTD
jgi:hypothetical protein